MRTFRRVMILSLILVITASSMVFGEPFEWESDIVKDIYNQIGLKEKEILISENPVEVFTEFTTEVEQALPLIELESVNNIIDEMIDLARTTMNRCASDKEAKKVAESLFQGIILESRYDFSYDVINNGNQFFNEYIAFSCKEIFVTSGSGKKVTMSDTDLERIVSSASSRYARVKYLLKKADLNQVFTGFEKQVTLALNDKDVTTVTLTQEQIDNLVKRDCHVNIDMNDTIVSLTVDQLATMKDDLTVKYGQVTDDDAYQLSLLVADQPFLDAYKVALPFNEKSKHIFVVEKLNDKVLEQVDFTFNNGQIVFETTGVNTISSKAEKSIFTDLHYNNEKWILPVVAKGYMKGKTTSEFEPKAFVERGEFYHILVDYLGLDGEVDINFFDVDKDYEFYNSIGLAGKYVLTVGSSEGRIRPTDYITREEVVASLAHAYKFKFNRELTGGGSICHDMYYVSEYAKLPVFLFKAHGVVDDEDEFWPLKPIKREDLAKMLLMFDKIHQ